MNRFGQPPERDTRSSDLHKCPKRDCASEFVIPVDWVESGTDQWTVTCRCAECEWQGIGVHTQEVVDAFDRILDEGANAIRKDLGRIVTYHMQEDIQLFHAASEADAIWPEDFGPLH